jgi:hypothetical protein
MINDEFFKRDTDVAKVNGDGMSTEKPPHPPGDESLPSNLKDAILENARGPKKVAGDAGSVEQHSLSDCGRETGLSPGKSTCYNTKTLLLLLEGGSQRWWNAVVYWLISYC